MTMGFPKVSDIDKRFPVNLANAFGLTMYATSKHRCSHTSQDTQNHITV